MKEIKVAVIGVGAMGKNHVRVYSELPSTKLVAISDANMDTAKLLSKKYNVPAYENYMELLEEEKPDAVSIVVPTIYHKEVGVNCIRAGVDVLMEKPIASNLDEADALIRAADETGRKLMIGHIIRFSPVIQELKRRISAGELGRIFHISAIRTGPYPSRINDVGVAIDLAVHDLDAICYILDSDPIRIYGEVSNHINEHHEDILLGLLRFPGNITASLEISWLSPIKIREMRVIGERGMFLVDDLNQDLFFYENKESNSELWLGLSTLKGVSEGRMIKYPLDRYEPLKAEIESFIKCIVDDVDPFVTGAEGKRALSLAMGFLDQGKENS